MKRFLRIAAMLAFAVHGVFAQTWNGPFIAQGLNFTNGGFTENASLVVVNGFPAVAYYDVFHKNLMFVRATDASGTSWAAPIMVQSAGSVGEYCEMFLVAGNPAIFYDDNGAIMFVRSNDANGDVWGTPVMVESSHAYGSPFTVAMVNGNPAIGYEKDNTIFYKRANNSTGTDWSIPAVSISAGTRNSSLEVVNGRPAMLFVKSNSLLNYVRANDSNGTAWPASTSEVGFAANSNSTLGGGPADLKVVNGKPAIGYVHNPFFYSLKYEQANEVDGNDWTDDPIELAYSPDIAISHGKLAVVNGNPAVFYGSGYASGAFYCRRSTQPDGTDLADWGAAVTIGPPANSVKVAFSIVNGNPAVCAAVGPDFNFTRATDANGGSWASVEIAIKIIDAGPKPSGMIVSGNPAFITSAGNFVRANNAPGTVWGAVVPAVSGTTDNRLLLANSNPAVMMGGPSLKFERAQNAFGSAWGNAETVISNTSTTYFDGGTVNLFPAAVFKNGDNVQFVRAANADGSSWPAAQTLNSASNTGTVALLPNVNGFPAVAFCRSQFSFFYYLDFIRATDASGTSWGAAVTVASETAFEIKMKIVNGNPAILYASFNNGDVRYIRANNADGTSWPASPQIVVPATEEPFNIDLEIISGKPVITYVRGGDHDLMAKVASDANGNSWDASQTVHDAADGFLENDLIPMSATDAGIVFYSETEAFPLFTSAEIALPLELTAFRAFPKKSGNELNWQTGSETQTSHFDIERSPDGHSFFEKIGETAAAGHSSDLKNYEFSDRELLPESYYRLKMMDNDGRFEYSKVVFVKRDDRQPLQVFPNPVAGDEFEIQFDAPKGDLSVSVFDPLGRLVLGEEIESTGGLQVREFNIADLPPGNYQLQMKSGAMLQGVSFLKN